MGETELLVEQIRAQLSLIGGLQENANIEAQRWQATLNEIVDVQQSGDHYAVLRDQELQRELLDIMRSRVSTAMEIERAVNHTLGLLSEFIRTGRAADPAGVSNIARFLEDAAAEARGARNKAEQWLSERPRVSGTG
jgi:hypothetical protein